MQTIIGPRTDLTQKVTYGYYSDTDTDLSRRGELESITDAASHVANFASAASPNNTYTIYGEPLSSVDPNGVTTILGYDARGRLTSNTLKGVTGDTTDLTTSYSYDATGKLMNLTRPLGNGVQYAYDNNNNLINTILLDNSGYQHDQTLASYDVMSRLTGKSLQSCTIPTSACSTWSTQYSDSSSYTPFDNLLNTTFATGGSSAYTYDGTGNTTSSTVGDSSYAVKNFFSYDLQHNLISRILGGSALAYSYDLQLNRTTVSPSNATATSYVYDDFHRLEQRISPFSGTTTYTYDAAGNLTSKVDGNGTTTTTTYDALNRPLTATSSRSGATTETVSWAYDDATSGHFGIGRLSSMTDPSGSTTYTYERHGLQKTQAQIANGTTYTSSYSYDGNGNRTSITLPSTRVLTYSFDYADRPESVVSGTTTYVSAATYKPFGPLTSLTFGNGTTQTKSYTQRYIIAENKVMSGGTALSDVVLANNATGFITSATDQLNSNYNQSFSYGGRATDILTQVTTGSSLWGTAQYADTYNQNLSSIAFPSDNYGLTYNRSGVLTSLFNGDAGTSQAVSYDNAGNETAVGTSTYSYSTRNHLSSGDGVTYTYDGWGRRVSATSSAGTRTSLYDAQMHLQSETALSSGSIAYDYIWFAGLPVAQEDVGGNTHWTVTDYRNAPFMQTNSIGAVYWQADYAPYGAVYALRTSDVHQPLRLPGQEAEEFTTGNPNGYTPRFYNGFRWYRPALGRYTQADPLDYGNGAFNLYLFANNNPINVVDPLGLCAMPPWMAFAGAMAAAAAGVAGVAAAAAAAAPALGVGLAGAAIIWAIVAAATEVSVDVVAIGAVAAGTEALADFAAVTTAAVEEVAGESAIIDAASIDASATAGGGEAIGAGSSISDFAGAGEAETGSSAVDVGVGDAPSEAGDAASEGTQTAANDSAARENSTAGASETTSSSDSASQGGDSSNVSPDLDVSTKIANQMVTREWSNDDITNAFNNGEQAGATNFLVTPPTAATRYSDPNMPSRFVVIDNTSGQIIQVSEPNFRPSDALPEHTW